MDGRERLRRVRYLLAEHGRPACFRADPDGPPPWENPVGERARRYIYSFVAMIPRKDLFCYLVRRLLNILSISLWLFLKKKRISGLKWLGSVRPSPDRMMRTASSWESESL